MNGGLLWKGIEDIAYVHVYIIKSLTYDVISLRGGNPTPTGMTPSQPIYRGYSLFLDEQELYFIE